MADDKQGDQGVHQQSETETGIHDSPNQRAAPGQSSASDWDMDRTKPSSSGTGKHGASEKSPAQQAPQDGKR
jgi:hypothetical protein